MNKKMNFRFLIQNIFIPITIGSIIYYISSPNVIFVRYIDTWIGNGFHFELFSSNNILTRFIRNYLLDMLWAYSLVFALYYFLGNNTVVLLKTFFIALLFSIIMELIQLTPIVIGTFDIADIEAELLAEILAVFIIKNHTTHEGGIKK